MPRIVRGGLIQATLCEPATSPVEKIKQAMIDKHVALIAQAANQGVEVVCLQELFYGPYFCAEQETKWYDLTERIPDGPTTKLMLELAKKHKMVIVVPIYEEDIPGVYYNTAAVIDADGEYLGKFRKIHIPHCNPGFWEKFYFRPGNLGYPGVRHQDRQGRRLHLLRPPLPRRRTLPGPERRRDRLQPLGHGRGPQRVSLEARATGARGGQPVLRRRDQSPRLGRALADRRVLRPELLRRPARPVHRRSEQRDEDDIVVADIDFDMIREVRNTWQFYRDRRPETYVPSQAL